MSNPKKVNFQNVMRNMTTTSESDIGTNQKPVSSKNERKLYRNLFNSNKFTTNSGNSWKRAFIKRLIIYSFTIFLLDFIFIESTVLSTNSVYLASTGTYQYNGGLMGLLLLFQVLIYQYLFRAESLFNIPNNKTVYTLLPTIYFIIFVIITILAFNFQIFQIFMYLLVGKVLFGAIHVVYRLFYIDKSGNNSLLQKNNNLKVETKEFSTRGYGRIGEE